MNRSTITKYFFLIVTSLISGFLGALFSDMRYEQRIIAHQKIELLKTLSANRDDVTNDENIKALNQVFIVYSDSITVLNQFKLFMEYSYNKETPSNLYNEAYFELLKRMAKDTNIDIKHFNDNFFYKNVFLKKNK